MVPNLGRRGGGGGGETNFKPYRMQGFIKVKGSDVIVDSQRKNEMETVVIYGC